MLFVCEYHGGIIVRQNDTLSTWQLSESSEILNLNKLAVGDVLDVCDPAKRWFKASIRNIGTKENNKKGKKCVHYMGRANRFDEWIDIVQQEKRLAKRYTNTSEPYRESILNISLDF